MSESNPKKKKVVRYMDFISRKPEANSDPLASRPVSRPTPKPKVEKVKSVADQIPPKGAARPAVSVKKQETKPFISRKPATSRDLYPEEKKAEIPKPAPKVEKPMDDLAIKASAAFSGTSQPAEKAPDNNAYSLGGKSPFLPNYSVDKRPLSNSVPDKKDGKFEKISYLAVNDATQESTRHKNVYKKSEKTDVKDKDASGDDGIEVIDDIEEKRGIPTWIIIILTIILGAATGAGVYFLLPK